MRELKNKIVKIEFNDGTTKTYYGAINEAIFLRLEEDGTLKGGQDSSLPNWTDYYSIIQSTMDYLPEYPKNPEDTDEAIIAYFAKDTDECVLTSLNSIVNRLEIAIEEYQPVGYNVEDALDSAKYARRKLFFKLLNTIPDDDFTDLIWEWLEAKVKNISITYQK